MASQAVSAALVVERRSVAALPRRLTRRVHVAPPGPRAAQRRPLVFVGGLRPGATWLAGGLERLRTATDALY